MAPRLIPDATEPHKAVWIAPTEVGTDFSVTATVTDATGLSTKGQRFFEIVDPTNDNLVLLLWWRATALEY